MPTKLFCWGDYAEYYDYLADGTKLSVTDTEENGLYYLGSLVYEKHANTIGLESVPFSSGRIVATSDNNTEVRYFLTDHLGSVRVVATDKDNVFERNDYQPFGKRWNTASLPVSDNRDRFSGKEDQAFVGLPFSDYGTRMYDSERMRWLTQDPLMEKYYSIGQYNYCAGNPVKYMDQDGREIRIAYNTTTKSGRTVAVYATYSQGNITYTQGATPTTISKEFVQQVQADLNQLAADNPVLAARIETLENSDHVHTIERSVHHNGNTPESAENDMNGIPTGSTTAYNPNLESTPSAGERPARAGLAHELLGHGYDSDQGITNHQKTSNGIPMSEVNAVNTENLVRKASNTPIRTTYDDKPIPHKLLQDPQQ